MYPKKTEKISKNSKAEKSGKNSRAGNSGRPGKPNRSVNPEKSGAASHNHEVGVTPSSKVARASFVALVSKLIEPIVVQLGFEMVLVGCPLENGYPVLRIFIEHLPEEGQPNNSERAQVVVDDCAQVAKAVDEILEAHAGEVPGGYILEVSSPGLDRPLVREADFERFQGRLIKVKLQQEQGGTRVLKGCLTKVADTGSLAINTPDGILPFSFNQVSTCRLSLDEIVF